MHEAFHICSRSIKLMKKPQLGKGFMHVVKVVVVIPSFNHLSVEELEKELDVHYLTRPGPRATGRQRFHA